MIRLGIAAVVVLTFLAPPVPPGGHAGPTKSAGTCRAKDCGKCDQAALENARAELEKLKLQYKELSAKAESLHDKTMHAYDEGNEIFEHELSWTHAGMLGGELAGHLAAEKWVERKFAESVATRIGTGMTLLSLANLTRSLVKMDVRMLGKLNEGNRFANEARRADEAALRALGRIGDARARVARLERDCRPPGPTAEEEEAKVKEMMAQHEREKAAAEDLVKSWRQVQMGYVDARGNFHHASFAFEDALKIVRSRKGASIGGDVVLAALAERVRLAAAAAPAADDRLSSTELAKFVPVMAKGYEHLGRAARAMSGVRAELEKISQLRAR